jgi:hypothetical protein
MLSFLSFFLIEFQKNMITRLGYNYPFNYFEREMLSTVKLLRKNMVRRLELLTVLSMAVILH